MSARFPRRLGFVVTAFMLVASPATPEPHNNTPNTETIQIIDMRCFRAKQRGDDTIRMKDCYRPVVYDTNCLAASTTRHPNHRRERHGCRRSFK